MTRYCYSVEVQVDNTVRVARWSDARERAEFVATAQQAQREAGEPVSLSVYAAMAEDPYVRQAVAAVARGWAQWAGTTLVTRLSAQYSGGLRRNLIAYTFDPIAV